MICINIYTTVYVIKVYEKIYIYIYICYQCISNIYIYIYIYKYVYVPILYRYSMDLYTYASFTDRQGSFPDMTELLQIYKALLRT